MKKTTTVSVSVMIALAVGATAWGIFESNRNNQSSTDHMNMKMTGSQSTMDSMSSSSMVNTSSGDYKEFAALKGEEYDRMFLAMMVAHHQGAIDMAKLAPHAMHQEIKDLAASIVTAQSLELNNMVTWQSNWGYPASSGQNMMDHSAMGMMDDMAIMVQKLTGLNGAAFDKQFLALMIAHHQTAIDMAATGSSNAQHSEVKSLAQDIVTNQSKEITQMKQWQKAWGYTQ